MSIPYKNIFFILFIITINNFNFSAQTIDWGFTIDAKVINEQQKVLTDVNNNIYTCGFFENTSNFDPLGIGHTHNYLYSGSTSQSYRGGDGYVAKYDSNGLRIWSAFFEGVAGGYQDDWIQDMYVDKKSNLYIAGIFDVGVNLTTDLDTLQFTLPASYYKGAIVIKFDSLGNYINSFQINGCQTSIRITVDSLSNIYLGGMLSDESNIHVDIDPSSSIFELYNTLGYDGDGFIAKYDSVGQLLWGKKINGISCTIIDLEIDHSNKLWGAINVGYKVHLDTLSSNSLVISNRSDIVLASYDISSGQFNSFFKVDGSGKQIVNDIEIDSDNNIIIAGGISGETDVDPGPNLIQRVSGNTDLQIFIGKYSNTGDYIWDIHMGGGYGDIASTIYLDKFNNIFTGGGTGLSIDFDPSTCNASHNSNYNDDLFIAKYSSAGNYLGHMAIGASLHLNYEAGTHDITLDKNQNIIITGTIENSVDFDPSSQEYILNGVGGNGSTFLSKYTNCSFRNSNNCFKGCIGDSVLINGQYYTSDTILIDSLLTYDFCDSIVRFNVDIKPIINWESNYTFCEDDSIQYYSSTGQISTYWIDNAITIIDTNISACRYWVKNYYELLSHDSIIEYNICTGDSLFIQGEYRKQAGIFIDSLTSINGCDSIIKFRLIIDSECFVISRKLCFGDSIYFGGEYISSPGIYTDSLITSTFTDSIINLNLFNFPYLDTSVSVDVYSNALGSNSTIGGSYQWIECSNNFNTINGEVNQNYYPNDNGSYAVIINYSNCIDTSACYSISSVGLIENNFNQNITIYPNPTNGLFSIDMGEQYQSLNITMSNNNGKVIFKKNYKENRLIKLNIEEPAGIYFFIISTDLKKAVIRLIKE